MPSDVRGQSDRRRSTADGARFICREASTFGRRRKTEMVKQKSILASKVVKSSKLIGNSLPALLTCLMVVIILACSVSAQSFNKIYAVPPETSEIEVVNQMGSIKVIAGGNPGRIMVSARHGEGAAKIDATQNVQGKVKIDVSGQGIVDFEITVPASSNVDLLCYK